MLSGVRPIRPEIVGWSTAPRGQVINEKSRASPEETGHRRLRNRAKPRWFLGQFAGHWHNGELRLGRPSGPSTRVLSTGVYERLLDTRWTAKPLFNLKYLKRLARRSE